MQSTRRCDWETFPGKEKVLADARMLGPDRYKEELCKRRNQIRRKYLPEPPRFVMRTIINELNIDNSVPWYEAVEAAFLYWRLNREKYPPKAAWMYLDDPWGLSFNTARECMSWAKARMKEMADPAYWEAKRKKELEEKKERERRVYEARVKDPTTWEYHLARAEETKRKRQAEEEEEARQEKLRAKLEELERKELEKDSDAIKEMVGLVANIPVVIDSDDKNDEE